MSGEKPSCPRCIVEDEDPIQVAFVLGDPAYLLLPYRRKKYMYPSGGAIQQEQYFGYRLCSERNVIKCACLWPLKGTFLGTQESNGHQFGGPTHHDLHLFCPS